MSIPLKQYDDIRQNYIWGLSRQIYMELCQGNNGKVGLEIDGSNKDLLEILLENNYISVGNSYVGHKEDQFSAGFTVKPDYIIAMALEYGNHKEIENYYRRIYDLLFEFYKGTTDYRVSLSSADFPKPVEDAIQKWAENDVKDKMDQLKMDGSPIRNPYL